jgi:hypothetical protein
MEEYIGRLVSHLNHEDPNVIYFLEYILPEIERADKIFRVHRRHAKYLCPVCLMESKLRSQFIDHLQSRHSDKLPENGQIFKIVEEESIRFKAEELRLNALRPRDPKITQCFASKQHSATSKDDQAE